LNKPLDVYALEIEMVDVVYERIEKTRGVNIVVGLTDEFLVAW